MAADSDDQGFIPGVYNYCDRWCERCPFASRCRVYAMEMTIRIDGFDGELARAAESLPADPAEEWAGDDFLAETEDVLSDEEFGEEMLARDVADALAEVHPLTDGADSLAKLAKPLIDAADARVTAGGHETEAFRDPLEVLAHSRHFVAVKVRRGLSGRDNPPINRDVAAFFALFICVNTRSGLRRAPQGMAVAKAVRVRSPAYIASAGIPHVLPEEAEAEAGPRSVGGRA